MGFSPRGRKEWDVTEHACMHAWPLNTTMGKLNNYDKCKGPHSLKYFIDLYRKNALMPPLRFLRYVLS